MKWKIIPGFRAYEVSEYGQVRRAKNLIVSKVGHRKKPGVLLKPYGKYGGYRLVNDGGKIVDIKTNRLVLLTFVGPRPSTKHFALHSDDDQSNNYYKNLYWGTHKENGFDSAKNGKRAGERNGGAKLTEADVLAARKLYEAGDKTLNEIASMFYMTVTPIWMAIIGETWAHLPGAVRPKFKRSKVIPKQGKRSKYGQAFQAAS